MHYKSILKNSLGFIAFTIFSSYSLQSLAHSEHDKARFVANQGKDIGRCDNVLRPCKTIAYAVSQANKGDKILVAGGQYNINSSEELFYLKSALVPILGGYNRFDHFQSQSPNSNPTTLTGIPVEMAEELRKQGFSVISDGKSLFDPKLKNKLSAYHTLNQKQIDQACVNGKAGSYDCNNIDLLAHIPLQDFFTAPIKANDIWGHFDLNTGEEYALIGLHNGIAVVNVTDPQNPTEVGTIRGSGSSWRDIKVYQYFDTNLGIWQAYAYATIDQTADEVTIIDLSNLPHSVNLAEKNNSVNKAHNVYISNVDYSYNVALPNLTPILQLTGADKFGGAFHNYSLDTPSTIQSITTGSSGSGYTHDGASLVVSDNRKTTNCNTQTDCVVFIDFNEKEMKLWNITTPNQISELSSIEYNDVPPEHKYVHSGWATEDKQYIFLHDEFDESKGGLNSTVRIFSISDLTAPIQVGQWTGPTRAIDHNGFARGNRYYLSNYERGLSVLDISNPASPKEIGFFDTYTPSNNAAFSGAWGVYPFLPSGNILVSDINSGLYILKDNTLTTTQGEISFNTKSVQTTQGKTLDITVYRDNTDNNATSVTVGYELIPGSATANNDYTPTSGILTWTNNDASNKTISIPIAAQTDNNELSEMFLVRLFNPTNGATIKSPSYLTVQIDGKPHDGVIGFAENNLTVLESQTNISIPVNRIGGSSGEVKVNYQLTANSANVPDDVANTQGQLVWSNGNTVSQNISLSIVDDNIDENDEQFSLILTSVDGSRLNKAQLSITISDNDRNSAPNITDIVENFEVNTGQTVELSATATDAENDNISYLWKQTSGADVTLNTPNQAATSFIAPNNAGTLTFELTVTDSKNASSSGSVSVTVVAPPTPAPTPQPAPAPQPSSGGGSMFWLIALLALVRFKKLTQA